MFVLFNSVHNVHVAIKRSPISLMKMKCWSVVRNKTDENFDYNYWVDSAVVWRCVHNGITNSTDTTSADHWYGLFCKLSVNKLLNCSKHYHGIDNLFSICKTYYTISYWYSSISWFMFLSDFFYSSVTDASLKAKCASGIQKCKPSTFDGLFSDYFTKENNKLVDITIHLLLDTVREP